MHILVHGHAKRSVGITQVSTYTYLWNTIVNTAFTTPSISTVLKSNNGSDVTISTQLANASHLRIRQVNATLNRSSDHHSFQLQRLTPCFRVRGKETLESIN